MKRIKCCDEMERIIDCGVAIEIPENGYIVIPTAGRRSRMPIKGCPFCMQEVKYQETKTLQQVLDESDPEWEFGRMDKDGGCYLYRQNYDSEDWLHSLDSNCVSDQVTNPPEDWKTSLVFRSRK